MTEHITFRCPDDVYEAVKQQIEGSGKSRSDVLTDMLRSALPSVRVEAEVWQSFREKAASDGQTANSVLNQLIHQYLDGVVDAPTPQTLALLAARLEEVEERLTLLENPETKFAFLGRRSP